MTTSIDLKVNADKVALARKQIQETTAALEDMQKNSGVNLDVKGYGEFAEMAREMNETMRKLETMSSKISAGGGQKTVAQEQEAARLLTKQRSDAEAYEKALAQIGTQLDNLFERRKKLMSQEFVAGSDEQLKAQQELDRINKELDRKTETYEEIQKKYDPRVDRAVRRSAAAGSDIDGYGEKPEGGDGGAAIKKLLIGGMALWGGMSIISMLRESWEKYKAQSQSESGLHVRGVEYSRSNEWGFLPGESADMAMGLRRATGAKDLYTQESLQRLSRNTNMDSGQLLGVMGNYYQATGGGADKQQRVMDALLVMGQRAKDGREEALLQLISQNLRAASAAQGGRALSDSQVAQVMAGTGAMYNAPGTMGMSGDFFGKMQGALGSGGDATGELLKYSVMGGFEGGALTAGRVIELQKRRQGGLNDPGNRARLRAMLQGRGRDEQIMLVQMMMGSFNQPGGTDFAEEYLSWYGSEGKFNNLDMGLPSGGKDRYHGTAGAAVASRAAEKERQKIGAGEVAEHVLGPLESKFLRATEKMLDLAEWVDDKVQNKVLPGIQNAEGPKGDVGALAKVIADVMGGKSPVVGLMEQMVGYLRQLAGKSPSLTLLPAGDGKKP